MRGSLPLLPMRFHSTTMYEISAQIVLLVPFLRPSKLKFPAYRDVVRGGALEICILEVTS
jgi:hypothetical protein